MVKQILLIRDYLIVIFGAHRVIPFASLEVCDWVKSQYPLLKDDEVLIVTASLINSIKAMYLSHPPQQRELDKAVHSLIADRYKK
jgi:hypothetical protein